MSWMTSSFIATKAVVQGDAKGITMDVPGNCFHRVSPKVIFFRITVFSSCIRNLVWDIGVSLRMAVQVFSNEAYGGSCWYVGLHQDVVCIEETCTRWQVEAYKIFLGDEVGIEIYLHCVSELLYLEVGPYPQVVKEASTARHYWCCFTRVLVLFGHQI